MDMKKIKKQLENEVNWPASEIEVLYIKHGMINFAHGTMKWAAFLTKSGSVKKRSTFVTTY